MAPNSKNRVKAKSYTTRGTHIANLPLELWDNTLRELEPQHAVTCMYAYEDVHTYLTSGEKSCATLWQTIWANHHHQPPSGPPHLTPGQYAEFLFGDRCMGCRLPSGNLRTHYALFTRHCEACYPHELVTSGWIINNLVDVANGERFPIDLLLLKDEARPFYGMKTGFRHSLIQASAELERYRRDCLENPAIQSDGAERADYECLRIHDRVDTQEIAKNVRKYVETFVDPTRPINPWVKAYHYILTRLSQEPEEWTEYDFPVNFYDSIRHYHKPHNERVWSKLYASLKPRLQKVRARKQLAFERMEHIKVLYYDYRLQRKDLLFPVGDAIFSLRPLRKIRNIDYDPMSIEKRWQKCLPELEVPLQKETKRVQDEVFRWFETCLMILGVDYRVAKLGLGIFFCTKCGEILWQDSFFTHEHFVFEYYNYPAPFTSSRSRESSSSSSSSSLSSHWKPPPAEKGFMSGALGPGTLRFELLVLDITMDLINAGSTLAELRNSDRQFVCLRCNEGDQRPLGFAALLQHIVYPPKYRYSHGPLRPRYKWDIDRVWYRTLTPSEAHDLQEAYERLRSPNVSSVGDYWLGGFMEEDLDSDDPVEARMRRLNAASSNTRD